VNKLQKYLRKSSFIWLSFKNKKSLIFLKNHLFFPKRLAFFSKIK